MAGAKKPLFILPNLRGGGAERATLQLLDKLKERGFEPTLLLLKREGILLDQVPAELRVVSATGTGTTYPKLPRLLREVFQLAREADIFVGALEHEACYFAWLAATVTRRPMIGWIHAVMSEHLREVSSLHTTMARWIYPRMGKLVFPSRASADSLASVARLDPARVEVIPSYVDGDDLGVRAARPVPPWAAEVFRKPTVVSVGRLAPSKGLDVLIRAHARVRGQGLDHHLLLVGEGQSRLELESVADRLGVSGSVFLPGFVENPYPLMKAAEVFALPSHFESMAVVLLEAMALGCAIVATDSPGGIHEALQGGLDGQLRDEARGLMVPPNDEVALADGIAKLLRDRALCDALGSRAMTRARHFNSESLIPKWERLLTDIG